MRRMADSLSRVLAGPLGIGPTNFQLLDLGQAVRGQTGFLFLQADCDASTAWLHASAELAGIVAAGLHRRPLLLGWDLRLHVGCQTQRCKQDQRQGEETWGSGKSVHSLIPWLLCFMVREGRSSAHLFIEKSMSELEGS